MTLPWSKDGAQNLSSSPAPGPTLTDFPIASILLAIEPPTFDLSVNIHVMVEVLAVY